ncbi:hypothetical protein D3C85_1659420 [compost metagenome]
MLSACFEQITPQRNRILLINIQFEAVFACITRAREQRGYTANLDLREEVKRFQCIEGY